MNRSGALTAQQATAPTPPDSPSTPSPEPEGGPERERPGSRRFSTDGVEWVAWVSGMGATGTGARGLGLVDAVHFEPGTNGNERKHREALIPRGRFPNLFDEELLTLFRLATPITASLPAATNGRRNGRRR